MAKLPVPDFRLRSVYELTPEALCAMNITLLLMDLDNTLAPYSQDAPTQELRAWIESMKTAGIEPFILSNNHGDRPKNFAEALGIDYVNRSRKPSVKTLFTVLRNKNTSPENALIIGDQIYTDVACGSRSGVRTAVVEPIDMKNPFFFLRYVSEHPFRAARKRN